MKCECGQEIKGNYKQCYACSQKFKEAKEFVPEYNSERARLMILSYVKDLMVAHVINKAEMKMTAERFEQYVQTGELKIE